MREPGDLEQVRTVQGGESRHGDHALLGVGCRVGVHPRPAHEWLQAGHQGLLLGWVLQGPEYPHVYVLEVLGQRSGRQSDRV